LFCGNRITINNPADLIYYYDKLVHVYIFLSLRRAPFFLLYIEFCEHMRLRMKRQRLEGGGLSEMIVKKNKSERTRKGKRGRKSERQRPRARAKKKRVRGGENAREKEKER
jgi:hypothetical protein